MLLISLSFLVAGTPEAGGWTTREVKRILRGLAGLNFVGADIVEVAPAYDHGLLTLSKALLIFSHPSSAEITATAAADLVHDILSMLMAEAPPKAPRSVLKPRDEL
jgi:agmatinase